MYIYLIDHEYIILNTLEKFLVDLGHEVLSFFSVSELLSRKIEAYADVIILDLQNTNTESIKMIQDVHNIFLAADFT